MNPGLERCVLICFVADKIVGKEQKMLFLHDKKESREGLRDELSDRRL